VAVGRLRFGILFRPFPNGDTPMRLLDLYCCEGGASAGYVAAGFRVVGVDLYPQPRYPHPFHQRDAIEFVQRYGRFFDAIHASPPCQRYSRTQRLQGNTHPDLIGPTREAILATGLPYIIENVPDARPELNEPFELCGSMFGLETYRHRLFETNFPVMLLPPHFPHSVKTTKMGRRPQPGEFMHVVGNFSGIDRAREVMKMPWASRDGLREAIPPAYTEWIGRQLMEALVNA